jgi:cytochrome o ubiquinol oxidase subunit 3
MTTIANIPIHPAPGDNQASAPPVDEVHHDDGKKVFGFWIYLMTDCILFATLFAVYSVLVTHTAGGPTGKDIFELPFVLVETFILLISSFTYGMAMLSVHRHAKTPALAWLAITFVMGAAFLSMEVYEFHHLIAAGEGPHRSAFLSAFFTLVGTHGLHVLCGMIWLAVLMIQVARRGITPVLTVRLSCLSLFWHFLDVVWICVFTVVYLLGVLQ